MRPPNPPICSACALRLCDKCIGCLCDHNDPTVMAAQALALTMVHFRTLFTDPAYDEALRSFERLVAMLPVPVATPEPRPSRADVR